jgi:hypothetical protein
MNNFWNYSLVEGHSNDPSRGACAMAAISWLVEGRHSDAPECACPLIREFVIVGNDRMDKVTRQRLVPYLHRIAGSRSAEHEAARLRIMVLAAARVFASKELDALGKHAEAEILCALPDDASYAEVHTASLAYAAAARAAYASAAASDAAYAAASAEAAYAAHAAARVAHAAARVAHAAAASYAAYAAAHIAAWDEYFIVLDAVLNAGPQGEPWSADVLEAGMARYSVAAGLEVA